MADELMELQAGDGTMYLAVPVREEYFSDVPCDPEGGCSDARTASKVHNKMTYRLVTTDEWKAQHANNS